MERSKLAIVLRYLIPAVVASLCSVTVAYLKFKSDAMKYSVLAAAHNEDVAQARADHDRLTALANSVSILVDFMGRQLPPATAPKLAPVPSHAHLHLVLPPPPPPPVIVKAPELITLKSQLKAASATSASFKSKIIPLESATKF